MNPHESKTALEARVAKAGYQLEQLPVATGFDLMLTFYRQERAEDCPIEDDRDMLLYEWGTFDWGQGEWWFELSLTRQFILADGEDEDIWQLALIFRFPPTDSLRSHKPSNRWCPDPDPRSVSELDAFIRQSPPFQSVADLRPVQVELRYQNAG